MIIIFKDSKIIGIDKELLKLLNINLETLSSLINEIDLHISSFKNENINIHSKSFKVKKIDILSIDNINIFNLEEDNKSTNLQSEQIYITPEIEPLNLQPQEEPLTINVNPIKSFESSTEINEAKIDTNNFQIDIEHSTTSKDKIEISPNNLEISINFEDEFSEIEKMLNLSKEEASKELSNELETAAKELSIDIETIYDLKDELFEILKSEKSTFFKALKTKDYILLHKTAHKLKGAALNLRLSNLSYILKKIDEFSKEKKDIHKLEYLINKFYEFLEKLEINKPKTKIPKEIKKLILNTIEDYLTTQNEKKFKKDLKYIEKLLNTKISSFEELEKIIKE